VVMLVLVVGTGGNAGISTIGTSGNAGISNRY